MAKIKYAEGATPLLNEHDGYTFQPSHAGQSMFPSSRSARKRYMNQFERMQNNQKAVTNWRHMSTDTKSAWNNFALTFPQPSKRDPNKFLTGYECFVKRNSFCFLNHGINEDFILEPELEVNTGEPMTFEIKSSSTIIECAENYIKNFGLLPQVGDKILIYGAVYSEYSGHFYESIRTSAIVEEVFIDSFQVTVNVPDTFNDVTISLYLSKPVSPGVEYVGTKIRYMGCFTTKTFLELQDTPGSYADKGHQIVRVNITEDGLEFAEIDAGGNAFNPITVAGQDNITADLVAQTLELVAGDGIKIDTDNDNKRITITCLGGGAFNCDDLLECDIFTNLLEIVVESENISIPAINYGLLYNGFAVQLASSFIKSGWLIPSNFDWNDLRNYYGGRYEAGAHLKHPGITFWSDPNLIDTPYSGLNLKGSGYRHQSLFYFTGFRDFAYIFSSYITTSGIIIVFHPTASNEEFQLSYQNLTVGGSIHIFRPATGQPDGIVGSYIGYNGRAYRTITINGYEWLADPLAETKFSDGSLIPVISDDSEWGATTSPAISYPEHDINNV